MAAIYTMENLIKIKKMGKENNLITILYLINTKLYLMDNLKKINKVKEYYLEMMEFMMN